jgi:hypothetical protein
MLPDVSSTTPNVRPSSAASAAFQLGRGMSGVAC